MNSVSYALDLKDYHALTRFVEKKRSGRIDWFLCFVSPAMFGFIALFTLWQFATSNGAASLGAFSRSGQWTPHSWNVLLWVGLAHYSYSLIRKAWARYRFRKNPCLGNEIHLMLSEKGVEVRGVKGESLRFWSHIKSVEITASHVFLFVSEKTALTAPKRAFASPAEADAFGGLAQKFWQQAHPDGVNPPIAAPR